MSEQIITEKIYAKEHKMFGKGIYEMTKDEMRDCIFKLRREVQFQEDCKDCAEEKLEIAESQGFFDGYKFSWYHEAWVKK
tara:strand:- start:170 stop:409 length:240 start_codon:yes stop_codon:yes gene_type:complete